MRELWGLVAQEVARIAMRRRAWIFAGAYFLLGVAWMVGSRGSIYVVGSERMTPTAPMLAVGAVDSLAGIVLFAPLLLGGTLAEDRASGFSRLLLSRCGSRFAWISAKLLGAFVVAVAFFVPFGLLLTATAAMLARWDTHLVEHTVGVQTSLASRPVGLVVVACVVLALSAAATSALSSLAAFFVRSPAVSLLVPVLAIFAAALVAPPQVNPYVRIGFLGVFYEWNTLSSVIVYWVGVLAASWAGCVALASWREE